MFDDESVATWPLAECAADLANALLGSFSEPERTEILGLLDASLDAYARSIGYHRYLIQCGSHCRRYLWLPDKDTEEFGRGRIRTDLDFISAPLLLKQPAYNSLVKRLSRKQPASAERLLICLLISRDRDNGDFQSIQEALEAFHHVQLVASEETAARRSARRNGGRRKSNEDKRRHDEVAAQVRAVCERSIAVGDNRADTWASVKQQLFTGEGYPGIKSLRRHFDTQFRAASMSRSAAT